VNELLEAAEGFFTACTPDGYSDGYNKEKPIDQRGNVELWFPERLAQTEFWAPFERLRAAIVKAEESQ